MIALYQEQDIASTRIKVLLAVLFLTMIVTVMPLLGIDRPDNTTSTPATETSKTDPA
jgi:hypothetical protein